MEKTVNMGNNNNLDKMERIVELSLLYDFYGELLKEHQKEIFEDYILNDWSLSEIAADKGISRQGVHDTVKRCSRQLEEYEKRLKLIEKFQNAKIKVNRIRTLSEKLKKISNGDLIKEVDLIEEIELLSNSILEEL